MGLFGGGWAISVCVFDKFIYSRGCLLGSRVGSDLNACSRFLCSMRGAAPLGTSECLRVSPYLAPFGGGASCLCFFLCGVRRLSQSVSQELDVLCRWEEAASGGKDRT